MLGVGGQNIVDVGVINLWVLKLCVQMAHTLLNDLEGRGGQEEQTFSHIY